MDNRLVIKAFPQGKKTFLQTRIYRYINQLTADNNIIYPAILHFNIGTWAVNE